LKAITVSLDNAKWIMERVKGKVFRKKNGTLQSDDFIEFDPQI
jgi:hypothetical protein